MNGNQLSKQMELPNNQKKQSGSLVSYLLLGLVGICLYTYLFGDPSDSEIEI